MVLILSFDYAPRTLSGTQWSRRARCSAQDAHQIWRM